MRNQDEFILLIKENEKIIFKITSFYSDTEEDRKDLYQEIVLQLWKAFPSFRSDSKISTWIYRIALNTAASQIRKIKKRPPETSLGSSVSQIADVSDHELEERILTLYKQVKSIREGVGVVVYRR